MTATAKNNRKHKTSHTSGVHLCFVQELNRIGVDDKEVRGFFGLS